MGSFYVSAYENLVGNENDRYLMTDWGKFGRKCVFFFDTPQDAEMCITKIDSNAEVIHDHDYTVDDCAYDYPLFNCA